MIVRLTPGWRIGQAHARRQWCGRRRVIRLHDSDRGGFICRSDLMARSVSSAASSRQRMSALSPTSYAQRFDIAAKWELIDVWLSLARKLPTRHCSVTESPPVDTRLFRNVISRIITVITPSPAVLAGA